MEAENRSRNTEAAERILGADNSGAKAGISLAAREMTAREMLDREIAQLELEVIRLRELRGSIPDNFPPGADAGLRMLVRGCFKPR